MRNLGFALVVASVVLSSGGVALVGHADSKTATTPAAQQSVVPDNASVMPAKKLPDQCGTASAASAKRVTPQPKLYRNTAKKTALPKNAIPLNTRGYNYGAQEMPQPPAAPAKP